MPKSTLKDQIKDLLIDIRCAYRDGLISYAIECEQEVLQLLFSIDPQCNKYGYYHGCEQILKTKVNPIEGN